VRFLFIRHGQTDYNLTGRVQGQVDIPLNELGRWQAEQIGERLKSYELCGIFASDLSRAHDTAKAIGKHHPDLTILTSELLREVAYGVFEGMQLGDIEQTYPEEYLQWRQGDVGYAPPGAENIYEQRARAANAIIWIREHCTNAEGTVAVVSHGTIGRALSASISNCACTSTTPASPPCRRRRVECRSFSPTTPRTSASGRPSRSGRSTGLGRRTTFA
jgi:probable phosphoglycerate mutase